MSVRKYLLNTTPLDCSLGGASALRATNWGGYQSSCQSSPFTPLLQVRCAPSLYFLFFLSLILCFHCKLLRRAPFRFRDRSDWLWLAETGWRYNGWRQVFHASTNFPFQVLLLKESLHLPIFVGSSPVVFKYFLAFAFKYQPSWLLPSFNSELLHQFKSFSDSSSVCLPCVSITTFTQGAFIFLRWKAAPNVFTKEKFLRRKKVRFEPHTL